MCRICKYAAGDKGVWKQNVYQLYTEYMSKIISIQAELVSGGGYGTAALINAAFAPEYNMWDFCLKMS